MSTFDTYFDYLNDEYKRLYEVGEKYYHYHRNNSDAGYFQHKHFMGCTKNIIEGKYNKYFQMIKLIGYM